MSLPTNPADNLAALIRCPSVTPAEGGALTTLEAMLEPMGFSVQRPVFTEEGTPDIENLYARKSGNGAHLMFAGHTDVVPTGPLEQWSSPPFTPTHRDGKLYGRGACDMKTSVAAFVTSIEEFLQGEPDPTLTLALLLTSDEEGPGVDGTVIVCNALAARGETIDYCIVGEPTSVTRCGDMIKNGRRGTMSGKLTVNGVQGHIAYPHLAKNPVHAVAPALAELVAINAAGGWDAQSNPYFQSTSWQISNFHSGTGASNVIPGSAVIDFNFRFSTESTPESLQQRVHAVLDAHGVDCTLTWTVGGLPFLTTPGELVTAVQAAIREETGLDTELSTSGGTSDARFIAKICKQVIECGPVNASIHKIDEHIEVAEIETLKNIYLRTLKRLDAALAG